MGSDDGWELFEARKRPQHLRPDEVALARARITFSIALATQFKASRAVLEFRAASREIKIRPPRAGEVGFRVSYRSIGARSFYAHFGIDERGRFPARHEDGAIVVRLR